MGLAEIEKRILEEAESAAEKIRQLAAEEADKLEAAAKVQAQTVRDKILQQAGQKAAEERTAILVPARLLAKRKILEEKHRILDEVFAGLAPEIREQKEVEVAQWLNLLTL